MKRLLFRVVILAVLGGALAAVIAWPRLNDVETGRTPEYPDLQVRMYIAPLPSIFAASKRVVAELPNWTLIGAGSGPAGSEIKAKAGIPVLPLKYAVTIHIKREKGQTLVRVRSKSEFGRWDFGQNARNIRQFQRALDEERFLP